MAWGVANSNSDLAALQGELAAIRAQNESLRKDLTDLRLSASVPSVSRETALDDLVARAVAEWMAQHDAEQGLLSVDGLGTGATEASAFVPEQALSGLLDPFLTWEKREGIWKAAHEAGRTEELIAQIEALAKADPKNVALQFELGNAYLQPIIQGEVSGMDAGTWSAKADKSFDAVLKLDENHWDARFSKAISYSFWPPIFGKQQAAIDHFEILVSKQSNMTPRPEFSQTYLYLGNMYEQAGNAAKAREAWNLGLSAFPQDRELRARMGLQ